MAPRRDLLFAVGAAIALFVIAFATGRAGRGVDDPDPRPSTYLTGRQGARALAEAGERLGVEVVRWRRRPQRLDSLGSEWRDRPTTVLLLQPSTAVSAAERDALVSWVRGGPGRRLALFGERATSVMRCVGFRVQGSLVDSARIVAPGDTRPGVVWVHATLAPDSFSQETEATTERDADDAACPPTRAGRVGRVDTLLVSEHGPPVLLQLSLVPAGVVLLGSDAALVRNRVLRLAADSGDVAALVAASVLLTPGSRLVVDEYHHGYRPGGSMAGAALAWSARHPAGWAVWQLGVVGLLALVAGAFRFAPVRASISRQRRDSGEHVRALATALSAARGHRVAIGALVRGVQRRLMPSGMRSPSRRQHGRHAEQSSARAAVTLRAPATDDGFLDWLRHLQTHAPAAGTRTAASRLLQLTDSPDPERSVLEAARRVEELWSSLRP